MPNISQSKSNQTIKFGQLIEYNKKIFLFKNNAENETGRLVPDLFFSEKALIELKSTGLQLIFLTVLIAFDLAYNKRKLYETLDY